MIIRVREEREEWWICGVERRCYMAFNRREISITLGSIQHAHALSPLSATTGYVKEHL